MGPTDPGFFVVGHVTKAHGIQGELYVSPLTDHPESTFAPGVVLYLGDGERDGPDPDAPRLRIQAVRPFKRGVLVHFGGVVSRNDAERLKGRYLLRPSAEIEPLAEGEVFYHQLLGSEVVTVDGERLGRVTEVYELHPSDLLEVSGEGRTFMIPYRAQVVVDVDLEGRRLTVDPPDGLLDL